MSARWGVAAISIAAAVALLAGCSSGAPGPVDNAAPTSTHAAATKTAHNSQPAAQHPVDNAAPTTTHIAGSTSTGHPTTHLGAAEADNPLHTVQVVPASDPARQADLLKTLCSDPIPYVTCVFTPTGPLTHVLGKRKPLAAPYPICGKGSEEVEVEDTTEQSDSLGVSVSVEIGKIVKQAVEASFSTTWSYSQTVTVSDKLQMSPHTVAYAYRSAPLVRAEGDMIIRETGATLPAVAGPQWYVYQLVNVSFDAPDTSPNAEGAVEFASRPMTAQEKARCVSAAQARKQGS